MIPTGQWPVRTLSVPVRWAASVLLAVFVALYLVTGMSVGSVGGGTQFAGKILPFGAASGAPKGPPPVPEPLAFRAIPPQDAMAINAAIPISKEPNPAAKPFLIKAAGDYDKLRSIDCLTAAVYYEAAVETTDGQRAVAQVVLNRLRHPAFPKTVCGVVFQGSERSTGCQFTFTCDGALARIPSKSGWERARKVAEEALEGKVYKPVGWATHYHTNWVVPYWSASLTKLANIGTHIFYRWQGGWGRPGAFRNSYAGVEPQIALMRNLSSVPMPDLPPSLDAGLMAAVKTLPPGVTTDDLKGRKVFRQYQPLRDQAAATRRSELARAEVPQSMRWALGGDDEASKAAPLGKPAEPAPLSQTVKAPAVKAPATSGAGAQ